MQELNIEKVKTYVEKNIGGFHQQKLKKLNVLKLNDVLKKKNPYLFKAKHILTSQELIETFLDAYLSSGEETRFGGFLEDLAIFICSEVYGGRKSAVKGVDLEFDKEEIRYLVAIKSGPNWANDDQIKRMKDNFKTAKRTLNTNTTSKNVVTVNGCCYGKDDNPDKGDYLKYCGQRFWKFLSGNSHLYIDIIEPLGTRAKEENDAFIEERAKVLNNFTKQFDEDYLNDDGTINWEKLVEYNSKATFS